MDTVGPRVFLKEAGKWETIELRFLDIFLIPKQRWREFVIIRLVPCAWRSWLKQSSVPKVWPRGTWKEQKMVGGCCKRPFLFIIDLHWIIWNHESTTGALVCLLPANTTNQHRRYPPRTFFPCRRRPAPRRPNYAQCFFFVMALHRCARHSNGALLFRPWAEFPSLSTKHGNQSFCVASPKNLWNIMSGLLVVSLKWLYMDMLIVSIGGFFPLLQHEIYFVVLDADEGSAFLTSQK